MDKSAGFCNWIFYGGANYVEVWADKWFVDSLVNTIVFAAAVVPVTIFLALVLAVVIDKFCYAKLPIRLAMFMPYISNVVAVAIVWVMMYSPWGPFTQMVKMLGVENPPQWLGDHHGAAGDHADDGLVGRGLRDDDLHLVDHGAAQGHL